MVVSTIPVHIKDIQIIQTQSYQFTIPSSKSHSFNNFS